MRTPDAGPDEHASLMTIDVEIADERWPTVLPDAGKLVERAAAAALGTDRKDDLVVLLANDAEVEDLNRRFRGKASPTNVLAFPAPRSGFGHLGDIAVALGVCEAEARAQNKALADHVQHLVVHGVLHLLGYDHQDDDQADVMESREREVLGKLGVPDPYAADRGSHMAQDNAHHG